MADLKLIPCQHCGQFFVHDTTCPDSFTNLLLKMIHYAPPVPEPPVHHAPKITGWRNATHENAWLAPDDEFCDNDEEAK